ncbi:type 4a pilus biogenesis protein PilO [Candidatus Microgenomates bacterium]|nr:type 4a pilus biogenesis protein PilO [Candidatus Microgenomates bacterium]
MQDGWRKNYTRYKSYFLDISRVYKSRPDLKSFLEIILSLVTILIFALFAIKPTILTIIELTQEIKNKEDVVLKLDQKITNLKNASIIMEQFATTLPLIKQSVPDTANIDGAIGQVQGVAVESGVEILGISSSGITLLGSVDKKNTKQENLPQDAGEIPVTVSVTGNYQNLQFFLSSIEKLRRPIKIDSFSINSSQTEEGNILVMVITGRFPYERGSL